MKLKSGTRLGPYEIDSLIASGGMGEIYAARDPRLDRRIAIKVIRTGVAGADERRRFLHEAKAASTLNHPHIITVHDIGVDQGLDYIAMELVEGQSLDRVIDGRPLPPSRALRLAAQVADAMAAAHAVGIVHRDIKPANIMVGRDDRVKVLDFGLARLVDAERSASIATQQTTAAGMLVGTLSYMAPEQAQGQPDVDHRADIFAFGAVLYEMLTGVAAFARESGLSSVAAVLHEEPKAIDAIRPDVSRDVQLLVQRSLRKDRTRRLQSMADLRIALQDAADDLASGRVVGPPPQSPRPVPWLAIALSLMAAVAIGAVVVWLGRGVPVTPPAPILTRMTFDHAFTVDPAVSPDGTLLAYATDRSGNLDIWLQQIAGGTPVQLTNGAESERQPSFSPDGSRIVFRSERDGGGLYVVPTLGGQPPRFLAPGGRHPTFSPDGTTVAYWTGSEIGFAQSKGSYRTFTIPATGGSPTEITGFTGARFPIWSPDGNRLLLTASRADPPIPETYDWWGADQSGGNARALGAADRYRKAFEEAALSPSVGGGFGGFGASTWSNDRLLFSDGRALWSFAIDRGGALGDGPHRLTHGTSLDTDPSVGPRGLIAFTSAVAEGIIWALPLAPDSGLAAGLPQRITDGAGPFSRPSASSSGDVVAYRHAGGSLLVRDLRTGVTTDAGKIGDAFGSALSPDGRSIAYRENNGAIKVVAVAGGAARTICENCSLGEWFSDSRSLILAGDADDRSRFLRADLESGKVAPIVAATGAVLNRPHLRPDDRALGFRRTVGQQDQVLVTQVRSDRPAGVDDWIPVTEPENDVRPCGWSADGRILYFVSGRDGYRCLYAQRIDRVSLKSEGAPFLVMHQHNARNFRAGQSGVLSTGPTNAVRGGKLFFDLPAFAADIWTLRPAPAR